MMELTIQSHMGKWAVMNKHPMYSKIIFLEFDTADEAMKLLEQLNGKPYEVIDAFCKTCKRIG